MIVLRTKEQLGYAVECGPEPSCGVLGFRFCVQSSEYNPSYLQRRLDNFINGLEELLEGLDDDSFENYKGGLMADLLRKDQSLAQESYRLCLLKGSRRTRSPAFRRRMLLTFTKRICKNHLPSVGDLPFVFGVATLTLKRQKKHA